MDDITIFLLVGSVVIILAQYYLKYPPVYLLGELFGLGGLYQVISEVEASTMDGQIGLIFSIVSIIAIIYSSMNLVNYWSKYKR